MIKKARTNNQIITYAILWVGSVIWLFIGFYPLIFTPDSRLMDAGVDGLRTYYTILYYLAYGEGWQFSGMNYPYQEFLIYADNLALATWLISFLSDLFSLSPNEGLAILHCIILFSFLITPSLIFTLLRHYELPLFYSMFIAWIIAYLSPQFQRIEGHLGLSFICFIPLLWMQMLKAPYQLKKHFVIALTIFTFSLLHPYYLPIGVMFTALYTIGRYIRRNNAGALPGFPSNYRKKLLGQFMVSSLLPVILFKLFVMGFDSLPDRPIHPYGFFAYETHWEGIFLPHEGPLWDAINMWVDVRNVNVESYGYVGIIAFFTAIGSLIYFFKHIRNLSIWKNLLPKDLEWLLLIGIIALLFSMALPFQLGLKWIPEYVPILKQFRALGRFSWIFYYTFTIYTAVMVYTIGQYLGQRYHPILKLFFLSVILSVWTWEAFTFTTLRRKHIEAQPSNIITQPSPNYREAILKAGLTQDSFQAILPIPYYHIGSEKFAPSRVDFHAFRQSLITSFQLALPLVTRIMPRASLAQSLKQVQLLSQPIVKKSIIRDLPNQKPLLVVVNESAPLLASEKLLLQQAEPILKFETVSLFSLSLDSLEHFRLHFHHRLQQILRSSHWHVQHTFYRSDSAAQFISYPSPSHYSLPGTNPLHDSAQFVSLYHGSLTDFSAGTTLEASAWIRADLRRDAFPTFYITEKDREGKLIQKIKKEVQFSTEVFRDWVRISQVFPLTHPQHTFEFYFRGKYATVDAFMLRDTTTHLMKPIINDSLWMYDNYFCDFN